MCICFLSRLLMIVCIRMKFGFGRITFWFLMGAMGQRNHWTSKVQARNSLCFCWPCWQHKPALLAHSRIFMPECGDGTAHGSNLTHSYHKDSTIKTTKAAQSPLFTQRAGHGWALENISSLCWVVWLGFCACRILCTESAGAGIDLDPDGCTGKAMSLFLKQTHPKCSHLWSQLW